MHLLWTVCMSWSSNSGTNMALPGVAFTGCWMVTDICRVCPHTILLEGRCDSVISGLVIVVGCSICKCLYTIFILYMWSSRLHRL